MNARVSLAELASAGFVLHSAEAAAIVVGVCRQFERGAIRGIPSTHVIRLTPEGSVVAEGPITTDQPPVAKAAQLLNDLLPPFDAPPAFRVPGGLRLVIARALGTLDVPRFESVGEFRAAIARFASDDLGTTARNLYRAWEISRTPRTLTISDLRRARRATGLSLQDISSACGVNPTLLRELEWGYLKNWRNDEVARNWLEGYARASGLDEQLVRSIVLPMLEEQYRNGDERDEVALVASGPQSLVPAAPSQPVRRRRRAMLSALAVAASIALLAVGAIAAWPRPPVTAEMQPPARVFVAQPIAHPAADAADAADATAEPVSEAHLVPAVQTRPAEKPTVTKAHRGTKRTAPSRKPTSKPNFFRRQLLRIVIK
jgi:cytoskeletal protein RodZ